MGPREKAAPEAAMGVGVWLRESLLAILLLAVAGARGEGEGHKLTHEQSLVAPAAPRTAGYPEEPYYDYATYPEASYQNQAAERVGAESLIAAPLIVTAFSAALFGGLLCHHLRLREDVRVRDQVAGVHPENLKVRCC